jgi:hypothetical protein
MSALKKLKDIDKSVYHFCHHKKTMENFIAMFNHPKTKVYLFSFETIPGEGLELTFKEEMTMRRFKYNHAPLHYIGET